MGGCAADRSGVLEGHYAVEKVGVEVCLRVRAEMSDIPRQVSGAGAIELVWLLHAEDDRSALKRNPAAVFADSGVGLEQVRRHVEVHLDNVIRRPFAPDRQVLASPRAADWRSIHLDAVFADQPGMRR